MTITGRRAVLLAGLFLLTSVPLAAAAPTGCVSPGNTEQGQDEIFLQDSGSTNTPPFCYAVTRSGKVAKVTGPTGFQRRQGNTASVQEEGSVPSSVAEKLFSDTMAAVPFSALPAAHCIKSASFGTSRYIWFRGERTPDLCGRENAKVNALREDFASIMRAAALEHPDKP